MELQNRLSMEAFTGLRTEVHEMRAEMTRRFEALEAAVLNLGHRVQALEARVGSLEAKTGSLEAKMGSLELAVRHNTEELVTLKAHVAYLAEVSRGKAEAKDVAALAERVARLEARVGL